MPDKSFTSLAPHQPAVETNQVREGAGGTGDSESSPGWKGTCLIWGLSEMGEYGFRFGKMKMEKWRVIEKREAELYVWGTDQT